MKRSIISLFLIIIAILLLGLSSCNNEGDEVTTEELLIGTWTTSDVVIDANVGTQSLTDYLINEIGMSPSDAATYNSLFENSLKAEVTGTLTFNSDHTYDANFGGSPDSGTWILSSDGITLTLDEGTTDAVQITINSISTSILNATYGDEFSQDLDDDSGTPDEIIMVEALITMTK